MINGKVISFGHGTIATFGSWLTKTLSLKSIDPPKEIGFEIKGVYDVIEQVKFEYGEDMKELYKQLQHITAENNQIYFRDYVLDFSNYNQKSVKVVLKAVSEVIYGSTMLLAC
jgi:hypothetical protein